jgi:two-component system sensor histidine kinase YesM
LGEELDLLEKYMIIQQYRYNDGITLGIQCPPELKELMIPRMLLQPIVENAIFHGIAPKEDEGSIHVYVHRDGGNAVVDIRDDGVGIEPHKIPHLLSGSGSTSKSGMTRIGLLHVHQTLQLYFGNQYGVQVDSGEHQGTRVRLVFPIGKGDEHVQSIVGR